MASHKISHVPATFRLKFVWIFTAETGKCQREDEEEAIARSNVLGPNLVIFG